MPCSYVIDKERRLVLSTGWGVLTTAEVLAHQHQLANDPDFDPDFHQLSDFTRITKFQMNGDEVRRLASRNLYSPKSRRAFVTRSTAGRGMVRMFEAYRELSGKGEQIRVFEDKESALQWLFDLTL